MEGIVKFDRLGEKIFASGLEGGEVERLEGWKVGRFDC
jgi:hypothetical protein